MRWDELFDDLEAQLAAAEAEGRAEAVADLTRAELATVTVVDRLRGRRGHAATVHLLDGTRLTGRVDDVTTTWLLLVEGRRQHLVPLTALAAVDGVGPHAVPATSARSDRMSLGHALRALARDRVRVQLRTFAGVQTASIARVGRDHLDVLAPSPDASSPLGGGPRLVPFAALLCVSES